MKANIATLIAIGCVAGALGLSGDCQGQGFGARSKADPRVRQALRDAGLKFMQKASGNYVLHCTLLSGRTHLAVVESKTSELGPLEVRDVYAVAYRSKELPPAEVMAKLLQDSATKKIGAWELHAQKNGDGESEGYAAIFVAKVGADCDAETLKAVLWGVVQTADAMEQELTSADEF